MIVDIYYEEFGIAQGMIDFRSKQYSWLSLHELFLHVWAFRLLEGFWCCFPSWSTGSNSVSRYSYIISWEQSIKSSFDPSFNTSAGGSCSALAMPHRRRLHAPSPQSLTFSSRNACIIPIHESTEFFHIFAEEKWLVI